MAAEPAEERLPLPEEALAAEPAEERLPPPEEALAAEPAEERLPPPEEAFSGYREASRAYCCARIPWKSVSLI